MTAEPQKHMRLSDYARMSGRLGLRRRTAAAVFGLHLGGTLFESAALVMMVPVYQYIQAKGNIAELIADQRLWKVLDHVYRIVDVPITLPSLLALSFVFILMRQVLTYLRLVHFSITRERFTRGIRTRGFQRYLQAGSHYHDGASRGAVTNDLTTELERVNAGLTGIMLVLGSIALGTVYASLLLLLSWQVTLVSLVIIVAILIPLRKLHHRTETTGRGVAQANRSMATFLVERLGSVRLIRLSGMEAAEENNMARYTGRLQEMMVRMGKLQALGSVIVEPVLLGLVFGLLYVGITLMNLGLEEIGLIFLVVLRLLPVTKEFMKGYQLAAGSLGSIEAIDNRLSEMAEAKESKGGFIVLGPLKGGIRFDHVTFQYSEPDRPALTDLSLSIPAGGMTALVGPSGAGKSTLIDLLPRLREPQSGNVFIDDADIRDLNVAARGAAGRGRRFHLGFAARIRNPAGRRRLALVGRTEATARPRPRLGARFADSHHGRTDQ